ncbi:MAG: DUF2442 domain-containing protein [Terrimicrobiaceae bacterium]|nr:DUF2442 domain-containing protein [Terrimicrobiaceae bacterium]
MRITGINILHGFAMKLTFSDGFSAEIDLGPALAPDDPLRDPALFLQGKPNGLTVEWPGGIDFCPDVLRVWCEAGKVLSPQETAAYFETTFSGGLAA